MTTRGPDATDPDADPDSADVLGAVEASLDPPMVVVVADDGDERSGCLVGFHSQCSIDPPRYVVWISTANHTFAVARRAGRLDVHVLASSDHVVAEVFGAATGDEVDKWAVLDGLGAELGPATWSGRVVTELEDDGDHVGFVLAPDDDTGVGPLPAASMRLHDVADIRAGHPA